MAELTITLKDETKSNIDELFRGEEDASEKREKRMADEKRVTDEFMEKAEKAINEIVLPKMKEFESHLKDKGKKCEIKKSGLGSLELKYENWDGEVSFMTIPYKKKILRNIGIFPMHGGYTDSKDLDVNEISSGLVEDSIMKMIEGCSKRKQDSLNKY